MYTENSKGFQSRRIPSINSAFEPFQQKAPPIPPKNASILLKHRSAVNTSVSTPPRSSLPVPPKPKPRTIFLQPHEYTTTVCSSSNHLSDSLSNRRTLKGLTVGFANRVMRNRNRIDSHSSNRAFDRRQGTNVNSASVAPNTVARVVRSTSLSFHALNPEPIPYRNISHPSFENSSPPDSGLHSTSETITPPLKEVDLDFRTRIQHWNTVSDAVHDKNVISIASKQCPPEALAYPIYSSKILTGFVQPIYCDHHFKNYLPPDNSDFQRRLRILMWVNTHFEDSGKPKLF